MVKYKGTLSPFHNRYHDLASILSLKTVCVVIRLLYSHDNICLSASKLRHIYPSDSCKLPVSNTRKTVTDMFLPLPGTSSRMNIRTGKNRKPDLFVLGLTIVRLKLRKPRSDAWARYTNTVALIFRKILSPQSSHSDYFWRSSFTPNSCILWKLGKNASATGTLDGTFFS